MKKAVVIICARGGSKGIKNKNLKKIGNLSLIEKSIKIAKKLKNIRQIIVSTDSVKIARIAKKSGAIIPELRPKNLAKDNTPEIKVWKYLIKLLIKEKQYKFDINNDFLISLSPTSPLRELRDIKRGIKKFLSNKNNDALVSISEPYRNPYFNMVKKNNDRLQLVCSSRKKIYRRQDSPIVYDMNTVVYIFKPSFILKANHLFDGKVTSIVTDKKSSVDIDDKIDLKFAKSLLKK